MPVMYTYTFTDEENLESWKHTNDVIRGVASWTLLICYIVLVIVGVVVLIKMLSRPEMRGDCFLITLSVLVALVGLTIIPDTYVF